MLSVITNWFRTDSGKNRPPNLKQRVGWAWREIVVGKDAYFQKREYRNYEDYLELQKQKLSKKSGNIASYHAHYRAVLTQRLKDLHLPLTGKKALCLAARTGAEVEAFIAAGAFAVGIDLNPGEGNKYVLHGDFHDIQFPAGSVDVVYTNSLDHAFDLDKLAAEIKRVLAADGIWVLEVCGGEGAQGPGFYESFWWKSIEDVVKWVEHHGFTVHSRSSFEVPWKGEALVLSLPHSRARSSIG